VRNPWSYYVSWYAFQAALAQPNPLFRVLSRDRTLDFAATVRNMLGLGHNPALLAATIRALPERYTNRGLNLPGPELARIDGSDEGFYSFLYRYMFGEPASPFIVQMENVRTELVPLLERVGVESSDAMRRFVATAPASNVSNHGAYTDYYDAELAELVARRDRRVIERFGYRFAA
jgi:hypothetical protein